MNTTLRIGAPITLLPSGDKTIVTADALHHFQVRGRMLALRKEDDGVTWRRGHEERPIE